MEGRCSTGQNPQWAVVPMEEDVASPALPYFFSLLYKRHDFREKLLNIKCVLIFSTTFV